MLNMVDVANATVRNSMLALSHLQNLANQKRETFHIRRQYCVVYNAAKT